MPQSDYEWMDFDKWEALDEVPELTMKAYAQCTGCNPPNEHRPTLEAVATDMTAVPAYHGAQGRRKRRLAARRRY